MSWRRLLAAQAAWATAGLALVAWAPIRGPAPRLGMAGALAAGTAAGVALFALLARRLPPPVARRSVACALAVAAPGLAAGAAGEEAVWRFGVLRGAELAFGSAAGFALSSLGFALVHVERRHLSALSSSHLLTGVGFGAVYLGTGRLAAAVAAHLVYNLLVVAACAAWPSPVGDPDTKR